jgi:phage baseplate assembly protein W
MFPVKVVVETVNALIVFEPRIEPYIEVTTEFEPTTFPVKVVVETVNALIVFEPRIEP